MYGSLKALAPLAIVVFAAVVRTVSLPAALPAQQPQPTARDSAWAGRIWAACDTISRWRTGQQTPSIKKQIATCKANADSSRKATAVIPPPVNQPPVASFPTPTCLNTTRTCAVNGSTSSDADGSITTYRWTWGDGSAASTGVTASHVYAGNGTYAIPLAVTDDKGAITTTARSVTILLPVPPDTGALPLPPTLPPDSLTGILMPEVPRSVPDASPKPCTRSVDVAPPMNLQTAMSSAVGGDCLELAPGAEWKGNFRFPQRSCTATTPWITIRTKGVADAPGVRVTPAVAATWAKVTAAYNQPAFASEHPSCRWQIYHLNIQSDPTFTGIGYGLANFGDGGWTGGGEVNLTQATQPYDFIIRRNWIHGQPTSNLVRCVVLNGIRIAVVDNWIEDCHASGFDSQAVLGWNGFGPFLIRNNYLAGAGENVMFGGADPAVPNLVPSDITIVGNHFHKPPSWKGLWTIKNLFELKSAKRVLVEGNVMENSWVAAQMGMAVVLKSSGDQNGANTPWQGTKDVTFRYNSVKYAHRGFNVQGVDCSGQPCVDSITSRVDIQHNLFADIGASNGTAPSDGWLMLYADAPTNILVRNNTFVSNTNGYGLSLYAAGRAGQWSNIRWTNNVLAGRSYYAIGADCAQNVGTAALNCLIGSGKWTWSSNVVSQVEAQFQATHPPGNVYHAAVSGIGLTADYRAPNYPGIGADITALNAKIAGVVNAAAIRARPLGLARPRLTPPTRADSIYLARQPKSNTGDIVPKPRPVPRGR
jgi:PKD repeat protein